MQNTDDLIPTTEAASILGKSVATVNRWAATGRLAAAVEMPGETGARLFRRSDVLALGSPEPTEAAS